MFFRKGILTLPCKKGINKWTPLCCKSSYRMGDKWQPQNHLLTTQIMPVSFWLITTPLLKQWTEGHSSGGIEYKELGDVDVRDRRHKFTWLWHQSMIRNDRIEKEFRNTILGAVLHYLMNSFVLTALKLIYTLQSSTFLSSPRFSSWILIPVSIHKDM